MSCFAFDGIRIFAYNVNYAQSEHVYLWRFGHFLILNSYPQFETGGLPLCCWSNVIDAAVTDKFDGYCTCVICLSCFFTFFPQGLSLFSLSLIVYSYVFWCWLPMFCSDALCLTVTKYDYWFLFEIIYFCNRIEVLFQNFWDALALSREECCNIYEENWG